MNMFHFGFVGILVVLFYIAIFVAILILIISWVNKFISLRREQNEILREILKKMDKGS
jgi:hypothetical protein